MADVLIEPAAGSDDVASALRLAWTSFRARTPTSKGIEYKETLWYADPSYAPENIIVARTAKVDTIAVIRLVSRIINRGPQTYSIAGITSVCVDEKHRGAGVSRAIMEKTLDIARQRGYDLAFLFARTALDNYYLRFGFHGLAAYSRLVIQVASMEKGEPVVSIRPARWFDIPLYARAYDHSYARCFGKTERSVPYWDFLQEKLQIMPEVSMFDVMVRDKLCGYAICGTQSVHELSVTGEFPQGAVPALIGSLARCVQTNDRLELGFAPQHAIVPLLSEFDMASTLRQCVYGGHMGIVLNRAGVLRKFHSRVELLLTRLGARPFQRDIGAIRLHWDGEQCRAELISDSLSYDDTCVLLGAERNSAADLDVDPALPLNIALADQF
jgi:GNAT superfamily N-acetyltransferase